MGRRTENNDEPVWTVLDWRILYEQMEMLRRFWEARLKLSYRERQTLPATGSDAKPES